MDQQLIEKRKGPACRLHFQQVHINIVTEIRISFECVFWKFIRWYIKPNAKIDNVFYFLDIYI